MNGNEHELYPLDTTPTATCVKAHVAHTKALRQRAETYSVKVLMAI